MKMLRNEHKPGNMAVLVQAPTTGLRGETGTANTASAAFRVNFPGS
jgi:hypothetical protein